jgi:glycosyltransferase involved in cell wall biosynthesis
VSPVREALARPLTVHHYGPDPAYVGGIGSVIRILTQHNVGADIAVAHSTWRPKARFVSTLLALRAALGIARLRRGDVVHVHLAEDGSFIREGALVVLARLLGRSTVVTIHGSGFLPFARRYNWLASGVLRNARVITCLDQEVLGVVRRIAPQALTELMPNPVQMDSGSRGADETGEIVLFAGAIGLRKGADVLCRAWRLVAESRPEARCVMVGPVVDFIVPKTERLEVRSPVDATEMRKLLRSARVVALPSRAEGMPMLLTEAMSAGRPFVSTPVGGIPELAAEGGLLVAVDDASSLAQRLIDFLVDPQFARKLGEQGRARCTATRSVDVIDLRLRELYRASAGKPGSRCAKPDVPTTQRV